MVNNLFAVFDRFANWKRLALELDGRLDHTYRYIDFDSQDINFDAWPPEYIGKYELVTNHATSEHLLNQYHSFKVVHELTKPGGCRGCGETDRRTARPDFQTQGAQLDKFRETIYLGEAAIESSDAPPCFVGESILRMASRSQ